MGEKKKHQKSSNRGKELERRMAYIRKQKCMVMVFKVVIKGGDWLSKPQES